MNKIDFKHMDPDKFPRSGPAHVENPLKTMQHGEQVIFEIRRHPAGILALYVGAGALLVVMAVMVFIMMPAGFGTDNKALLALGAAVFFIVVILTLFFTFISTIVYWGNRWIVTSDSLTQVSQMNALRQQSSQLSLENLEDISVEKRGVFAQLFNYGTLRAETAGESEKFIFRYCPNPNHYGRLLLDAREKYMMRENDHQSEPQNTNQPGAMEGGNRATVEQIGQAALADFEQDQS